VRPLVRQLVVDALAATGEWPISVRIVSSQGVSSGPMKRWFVVSMRPVCMARSPTRETFSTDLRALTSATLPRLRRERIDG
jgi:hypothetical protein